MLFVLEILALVHIVDASMDEDMEQMQKNNINRTYTSTVSDILFRRVARPDAEALFTYSTLIALRQL